MFKLFFGFFIFLSFISGQTIDPAIKKLINSQGINIGDIKNVLSPNEKNLTLQPSTVGGTNRPVIIEKNSDNSIFLKNEIGSTVNDPSTNVVSKDAQNIIAENQTKEIQKAIVEKNISEAYFGYNVFSGNPEIFQTDNLIAVDPEYTIGPGDEIIIMLWGETEIYETYFVAKDGYLFLPNVGRVFVNGLDLENLEKKLFKILKKVYSSLDDSLGPPASYFDVSLGSSVFRPLRAFVLGETSSPGAYNFKQTTSLFSSMFYFGGPNISGSLRDVKLIRDQKVVGSVDLYTFLLEGKKTNDIKIQRNDIIFLPKRLNRIKVSGDIDRALNFELKPEEDILDLIEFAGGLRPTTHLDRIRIDRILPPESRKKNSPSKTSIDIDLKDVISEKISFPLMDGDEVTFFRIDENYINVVNIQGSIKRPGRYQLSKNMNLKELILKSQGLLGNAFLERAQIIRKNKDLTESIIQINLEKAMQDDIDHNIKLFTNDVVTIFNESDMVFKTGVSILGHVNSPGDKPYYKGMKLIDLISMGGGFDNDSHLFNTYFERADLIYTNAKGEEIKLIPFRLDSVLAGNDFANHELKMGNKVRIYSYEEIFGMPPNTVKISGEVKRPGIYEVVENFRVLDLLFLAGGLKDSAFIENIYFERFDLFRLSNDKRTKNKFSYNLKEILKDNNENLNFNLLEGDEIIIYSKSNFIRKPIVNISGLIANPGSYELKNGMSLRDLIIESGGVSYEHRDLRIDIISLNPDYDIARNIPFIKVRQINIKNDFSLFKNNVEKFLLKDYDEIIIRPDPNVLTEKTVTIQGEVLYPGVYNIISYNEKVSDIIKRAGGLTNAAYPAASKFQRGNEEIKISYSKILKNPRTKYNFKVKNGDKLSVGSSSNIVEIKGAVNRPGFYQYIKGFDFDDYIQMAGGFAVNGSPFQSYVEHPDGTASKNSYLGLKKIKIMDSSIIHVPSKEEKPPFNLIDTMQKITGVFSDVTQQYLLIILLSQQIQQN